MRPCPCTQSHEPRRIVLTGGPGAGKTAVLELVRQSFCEHVVVLPESAGIVFGGGFPRGHAGGHYEVPATEGFMTKARRAVELLRAELPTCCRAQVAVEIDAGE